MPRCTRTAGSRTRTSIALSVTIALAACTDPVTPRDLGGVEVVRAPAEAIAGERVTPTLVVRAIDDDGRGIAGLPLQWYADAGQVTPLADTTGLDGLAAAEWRLPIVPGTYRLRAQAGADRDATITVHARAFRADVVDVGFRSACAITAGDLWCWGSTWFLERGTYGAVPGLVASGLGLREVALTDSFVCALDASRQLRCRGSLGSSVPEAPYETDLAIVPGMPPLRALADGDAVVCGIAVADETAWCLRARTATGSTAFPAGIFQVSPTLRFRSLAVGSAFACGLDVDGVAWCWGENQSGQLGDGTTASSRQPVRVAMLAPLTSIDAEGAGACAVEASYAVVCWGNDVGTPTPPPSGPRPLLGIVGSRTPVRIPGFTARQIAVGFYFVVGLSGGRMTYYEPFYGPAEIEGIADVRAVELVGDDNWCVRDTGGHVYCDGETTGRPTGDANPSIVRAAAVTPADLDTMLAMRRVK